MTLDILTKINNLPPEMQREVIDFIEFLEFRAARSSQLHAPESSSIWQNEAFFGIWQDRLDQPDSTEWVRELRQQEWG